MFAARSLCVLAALLAAHAALASPAARSRRQLADDDALQPLDGADGAEQTRDKRKFEGVTEAKFGIKNAVLGFVFGKINSLIDSKTRLVENLDKQNIEINKQYGIEAPKGGGLSSLSGIVGQVIGPKLQFLGPKLQAVTGLLGGASGGGGHSVRRGGELRRCACDCRATDARLTRRAPQTGVTWRRRRDTAPRDTLSRDTLPRDSGHGSTATGGSQEAAAEWSPTRTGPRPTTSPSPPSSLRDRSSARRTAQHSRGPRQAAPKPADDIPVFDRNKVSLDFPGSLFGPSVSLLIRTTKVIGDVIQNSAVRYQSFLRLFRPLFRGQFEIKGLDPPTTTTTTTTTTAATSAATPGDTAATLGSDGDNEISRRR